MMRKISVMILAALLALLCLSGCEKEELGEVTVQNVGQITGMAAYTINSDEADAYTYDKSNDKTMFRSSDHDPVLVGLRLDSTQVYDPSPQINSADVFSGNSDQMVILNAYNSNAHSYYAIYSINGFLLERKEIDADYYEVQLPTAPGTYIVYIYYNGEVFQRRLIVR